MSPRICLFDIDGTLLNSGGAGQTAMERALAEVFQVQGPYDDIPAAGRTDRAITQDLFAHHQLDYVAENLEPFLEAYFRNLPVALSGLDGRVLPGIPQLIADLQQRDDVVLGLLTGNYRTGAQLKLRHFELDQPFRFGGYGDHHLDRDDVARMAFTEAAAMLGSEIDPSNVWVIGDTPADVRCGRAIGANVIAVATGIYTHTQLAASRPDHLFADFSDHGQFLTLLN